MLPPPEGIWRQSHQSAQAAENIVGALRPEEGAVTTIVLDDEDPHEETGGEHRKRQGYPKRYCETEVHGGAGGKKPTERCRHLPEAAPQDRVLKRGDAGKNILQVAHLTLEAETPEGSVKAGGALPREAASIRCFFNGDAPFDAALRGS